MGRINPAGECRAAIVVHHTGTSDAAWDGPKAKAQLKDDQDAKYYEAAYAWRDAEGDPSKKSTYKFIHHDVNGEGHVGAANIKACQTGIAVLNGGRGGTTIPAADRKGVYEHLAAHLKDAGLDPAPLRSFVGDLERRMFGAPEFRVAPDGKKIEGYAAVFNSKSEDMMGFREQIAPGAFAKTIKEADVRALFNHDPNYVLGRNKAGTLDLAEDSKGLHYRVMPPDTQWARDLMESMKRGDINQSSFGFRTVKDSWATAEGMPMRTLHEVRLFDVSPVTYPAYSATESGVRGVVEALEGGPELHRALAKLKGGHLLSEQEQDLVRAHISDLELRMNGGADLPEDVAGTAVTPEPEHKQAPHSIDLLRRRLNLAAGDY